MLEGVYALVEEDVSVLARAFNGYLCYFLIFFVLVPSGVMEVEDRSIEFIGIEETLKGDNTIQVVYSFLGTFILYKRINQYLILLLVAANFLKSRDSTGKNRLC